MNAVEDGFDRLLLEQVLKRIQRFQVKWLHYVGPFEFVIRCFYHVEHIVNFPLCVSLHIALQGDLWILRVLGFCEVVSFVDWGIGPVDHGDLVVCHGSTLSIGVLHRSVLANFEIFSRLPQHLAHRFRFIFERI